MTALNKRAWDGMREEPETSVSGGTVMTQTNEELREKIKELFNSHMYHLINQDQKIDLIMSLISDYKGEIVGYEPLNVEIVSRENIDERPNRWLVKYKYATLDYFLTENDALDFCKRFNLKVVNEEKKL